MGFSTFLNSVFQLNGVLEIFNSNSKLCDQLFSIFGKLFIFSSKNTQNNSPSEMPTINPFNHLKVCISTPS